jgi:class 3 adenylate cyclase/pimeloyl-ACP methyl ester carboxylesterase
MFPGARHQVGNPVDSNSTRELAAIMFSDIAGYTLIMGHDEAKAIRALSEHRELLRSLIPKFNGRMLGEIGDGTLSSFHSATDAVNCARELQTALMDDSELRLRIGIHVGDVVFSNNNVVGDGVNVASRIHALAPPGGICVSDHVFDEIRNKPGMAATYLGEKKLKNVGHPIRVYTLDTTASSSRGENKFAGIVRRTTQRLPSLRTFSIASVGTALVGYFLYSAFYVEIATALLIYVPRMLPVRIHQKIGYCTTSDGVRIAYGTVGKGPPVVIAIGWMTHLTRGNGSPTYDSDFLESVGAAHHLVVEYDGRGCGLSERGLRDYSLEPRVRDLEAVVDALKLRRFTLYGVSSGGPATIAYAARHPERVTRIILYDTYARSLDPNSESSKQLMTPAERQREQAIALVESGWNNPAYREMFTSLLMPNGSEIDKRFLNEMVRISETPEDARAFLLAGQDIDVSALAAQIKAPTLIIHVRGDQVIPFAAGADLAALIPGARLIPIEGDDHISVPGDGEGEQIDQAVRPFLDQDLEPTNVSANR